MLHDGVLLSVEALLRWTCNGDLLPAVSFIHAVEDSPIIIDIGEWVMNEACCQVRAWRDAGIAPLRRAMERHGIEGGAIEIEITIDDFGTGYSSLAYLKRFAITGVKMDRSFVHDLPSRSATAIVNAIIATAHALGLRLVAEGVEHSEQAVLLEAAGCEEGQGYWFARPMSAAAFVEYLQIPTAAARPRL
jgi:diguanylate cyclase